MRVTQLAIVPAIDEIKVAAIHAVTTILAERRRFADRLAGALPEQGKNLGDAVRRGRGNSTRIAHNLDLSLSAIGYVHFDFTRGGHKTGYPA